MIAFHILRSIKTKGQTFRKGIFRSSIESRRGRSFQAPEDIKSD